MGESGADMSNQPDRFHLCAYVCGQSCMRPSPFDGWATFDQIFARRPSDCRYGVARTVTGLVVVWDFYDESLTYGGLVSSGREGSFDPPLPVRIGPSEDAMIMATMALYDR